VFVFSLIGFSLVYALYIGLCHFALSNKIDFLIKRVILSLFVLQDTKSLTISNVNVKKVNGDVLVVAVSPDAKYVAAAVSDCTVQV
jgi:hypothetical protein